MSIRYEPEPLTEFADAARRAIGIANKTHTTVTLVFNEHNIDVTPGDSLSAIDKRLTNILRGQTKEIDPEALGQQCAMFISAKWAKLPDDHAIHLRLAGEWAAEAVTKALELAWECEFWRSKALGTELNP